MHRRPSHRLAVASLAVAVALISGCASEDDPADDGSTSLIPPESTEVEPPDTGSTTTASAPTTSAPTTAAPSTPTAFAPSAREAIDGVRAAWETGDQAGARALAPGDVVDQLFAVPAGGFETYGCDTGEFATSTCNFRNRSTEAFIVVTAARSDAGWQVASIDVNLD